MSNSASYIPTSYVPTDSRLTAVDGKNVDIKSKAVIDYMDSILAYGPLPPNYNVELNRKRSVNKVKSVASQYMNTTTSNKSWDHPCSPEGLRTRQPFHNEFRDTRADIVAVYHPPMPVYKAGKLIWHAHDTWEEAIAASLSASGCLAGNKPLTDVDVKRWNKRFNEQMATNARYILQNQLYHPADRNTAVFTNEPECARVAKDFSRDLVLLCPETPANGMGWNRIYDQANRPPIRWRWSVGDLAQRKLTILACIPKYGKGSSKEVHWFTVSPASDFKVTWDSHLKRYVIRSSHCDETYKSCLHCLQ
jgi:hypothetical protein